MTIAKVEIERSSPHYASNRSTLPWPLSSQRSGNPTWSNSSERRRAASSFPDLERVVQSGLGRTGLMLFEEFDLGAYLRSRTRARDAGRSCGFWWAIHSS